MSNEVVEDPSHNNIVNNNIITQVESEEHLSQFAGEDDDEHHRISLPAVISSEIVLCLYEALEFLDFSYFEFERRSIPSIGEVRPINEYNPAIIWIIDGYKNFINNSSERVRCALAYIITYDFSGDNILSHLQTTRNAPPPHQGHNRSNVFYEAIAKSVLSEFYLKNPRDLSSEIEVEERDYLWPVSHHRIGYPPSNSIRSSVGDFTYFAFLAIHCAEIGFPSDKVPSSTTVQLQSESSELVVGTLPESPPTNLRHSPSTKNSTGQALPGHTGPAPSINNNHNKTSSTSANKSGNISRKQSQRRQSRNTKSHLKNMDRQSNVGRVEDGDDDDHNNSSRDESSDDDENESDGSDDNKEQTGEESDENWVEEETRHGKVVRQKYARGSRGDANFYGSDGYVSAESMEDQKVESDECLDERKPAAKVPETESFFINTHQPPIKTEKGVERKKTSGASSRRKRSSISGARNSIGKSPAKSLKKNSKKLTTNSGDIPAGMEIIGTDRENRPFYAFKNPPLSMTSPSSSHPAQSRNVIDMTNTPSPPERESALKKRRNATLK